jgi:eukaryotic-like serine/threonine-protein kinase
VSPTPGARLGVYEIIELIGAGGMGEVYRARDSRLTRDVALKFLPEPFALDPDRIARFAREAKMLASVNHPNIAAIYGFEDAAGVQALVLELVEGPTLADRIRQGPIPIDDALPVARQIAEALEAAHALGIVHRDLKPSNIKVRPDGTVKVLDLGLAKALAGDGVGSGVTESPTITSPALTRMGVILGTAAYMSPEQARGKAVDRRSDIWAFGAVLYEMLTGRRAFDGDEVSDTLANVLKSEPDWNAIPAETPSTVVRVLQRCLEKDPRRRFHDMADARIDLDERVAPAAAGPVSASTGPRNRERLAWALLAVSLAGVLAYLLLKEAAVPRVVRFQVGPPENALFGSGGGMGLAAGISGGTISPDGTRLAFVATDQTRKTLLWIRALDSFTARPLPETDGALLPFWSPDGRFIAFFAAGKLKKMNAAGGPLQTICEVPGTPRGATWGGRGTIVFSSGNPARLARVSADGGAVTEIQMPDAMSQARAPSWPHFLPDGRHFLYWVRVPAGEDPGVTIASIEPGFAPRRLVASNSNALFAPPGFLLFVREDTLMRQPFDPQRLELTGEATPIAERILLNTAVGVGDFSVSENGVLTFRSGANLSNQFAWFDRHGNLLETVGPPGSYRTPALSPDAKRLAYTDVARGDIWIYDLTRKTPSRFTANRGTETCPVWSLDGSKIMYRSDNGGLFEKNVSGTATEQLLLDESINGPSQVSPDGKWLLYFAVSPGPQLQDIFVLPLTGERKPRPIVHTTFPEVEPQLSPDGRWLAYASIDTGRNEVYVQPFPPTGAKWQVSNNGGRQPLWRADGKELFFVSDDRKFYAVDISARSDAFDYGAPHFLFDMRANVFNARNSYVPSPDGQRFLVNMLLDTAEAPINVVQNWVAELKK